MLYPAITTNPNDDWRNYEEIVFSGGGGTAEGIMTLTR